VTPSSGERTRRRLDSRGTRNDRVNDGHGMAGSTDETLKRGGKRENRKPEFYNIYTVIVFNLVGTKTRSRGNFTLL